MIKDIRKLVGYIENGSNKTLKIYQDDATFVWVVSSGGVTTYDPCLEKAIEKAAAKWDNNSDIIELTTTDNSD